MTNNQVIPITDGVRRPKRRRVAVRVAKGLRGIEIHADLVPDIAAIPAGASRQAEQASEVSGSIRFRGCAQADDHDRTYWVATDNRVGVLAAGGAKPADVAVSFSSLEELTMLTSNWRMPQFVSIWNKLAGVRQVVRFENRRIAVERLWRAIDELGKPIPGTPGAKTEKKKRAAQSKSERIIGLLRAPGGATLPARERARERGNCQSVKLNFS